MLYKSALAHDAGYLQLDPDRLRRILGRQALADADFKFIQSHARKGVEHFKGVKVPQEFKDAIVYHHERNDGSGYPKGLKGADIPLYAKIVGVAETYVALTSARPYREKLGSEAALAVIRDGIGRKFDKDHIEALIELVRHSGESS
jgi:HD-GYP domain-containing protein (c-di-GMP phosphodiesterase class II)